MCDVVGGLRVAVGVPVHIGNNLSRGCPANLLPVSAFSLDVSLDAGQSRRVACETCPNQMQVLVLEWVFPEAERAGRRGGGKGNFDFDLSPVGVTLWAASSRCY